MKKNKALIVCSDFYPKISKNLISSALKVIKKNKILYEIYKVKGSYEVPQIINILLSKKKYDFVLALGCIIKGETPHFDLISKATSEKLLDISIKYRVPISNGILSCLNFKQALARISKNKNRGKETANAALSVFKALKK